MLRGEGAETLLAAYNFSDEVLTLVLPSFPLPHENLLDVLTGAAYAGAQPGQPYSVVIPVRSTLWLIALP